MLEWHFLPILNRHERQPKLLHKALSEEPTFFIELMKILYRARGEEPRELSENDRNRTQLAFDLLHIWRKPPGLEDDGTVNLEKLRAWVSEVRNLALECNRVEVVDSQLGQTFSTFPIGKDGLWPPEPVRELLEELANERIESGIETGLFNSRGVVTRAIAEGGIQEREIAARYSSYAEAFKDDWPRTAHLMREMVRRYERDAREEDGRAELEEDLWR